MTIGSRYTALLAGFIGNVVEWYDFALYGYMAGILAAQFFPRQDALAALIATYGIFAAGFLMRPLGAAFFGWLGDTVGRSRTLLLSVVLMALPTFLLGCLPTHAQAGVWSPVLLVLLRLLQGLSVGGEFSSSVTYLVETAPADRRGFAGSWANTGSMAGMLLGAGVAALVTSVLGEARVAAGGWRIPFLLGGMLGILSILLRRRLPQSPLFVKHAAQRPASSPLRLALTRQRRETLQALGFAAAYGVVFYLPLVYLPEWLHGQAGMDRAQALRLNAAATALLLVLIPLAGWCSDHLLRRTRQVGLAMLAMAALGWPLYAWLVRGGVTAAAVAQFLLAAVLALPLGAAPAMFAELFPATDRLSGYSLAYNLGLGVVGGSTPMVATWLMQATGRATAPGLLLSAMALFAAATVATMRDGSREPLR